MKLEDLLAQDVAPFTFNSDEWHMLVYGDGQWPKSPIADAAVLPWWFFEGSTVKMGFSWQPAIPTYVERVRIVRDVAFAKVAIFAEYPVGSEVATTLNANHDWDGSQYQRLCINGVAWV